MPPKVIYDQKRNIHRRGTQTAGGFAKGHNFRAGGASGVGRYHPARAQRVDLLGDKRQESGDAEYPYQEGPLKASGRDAPALLLGRLSSPFGDNRTWI
ncbi:MAG: hypothetical protein A3C90_04135 [Candidatus Magasanikbacteria bacterium RIFCSPHIGHO2_02_FULL_51_14]|uniref:Uncharacterized protein n=1 Tax=Candidatus Magasanikbacteria bacterium RIFCSPHIGHO2_02_FULL_51_14 TaxID=1798683 RepID=A0A1F6MG44_9BACT|nr:MAG: hypothetical protein A3C90_04135 [Candidatus Magasanikbacteria bacterium RIFCSPHIGHO2_02_FULL_51_14]